MVVELELNWLTILMFSTASVCGLIATIDLLKGTTISKRLKSSPEEMLLLATGGIFVSLLLMLEDQQEPYVGILLGTFWLVFFYAAIILQYRRKYPDNVK